MGLRFRKSIKVAPGVKLNLGKKSAGMSIGGKYGGVSFNTKSGSRARISAPGTGISYSTKIGDNSNNKQKNYNNSNSSGNKKGGGCLIVCLKIFGIFLIIPFAMLFGWIAGIIWIIAFRKKMSGDSKKQKKYTIIISILSIISFLFMIYCFTSNSEMQTESISSEVSLNTEVKTEKDTNTEEKLGDTEYIETELLENETEMSTESESQINTDTDSKVEEELDSNTAIIPVQDVQNETTPAQESQIQESQNSEMVWVDDTAEKYHRKPDCSGMDNARQVTIEDAQALGKTACGRCYR